MEKINSSRIPYPIWSEILDNLNAKELANVSQVSKEWKKIALDESMWKKDSSRAREKDRYLYFQLFKEREGRAIVIDNGTYQTRSGFAGDDAPLAVFLTVGRPRRAPILAQRDWYVGENNAFSRRGILTIHYPINRGIITNMNDMENVWYHTFYNELRVSPKDHPIFLTDSPLNPISNRQQMALIMFETFNVPGIYIASSPQLSLYASGSTTGLVLDSGHSVTHSVVVHNGVVLPHATHSLDIGGNEVTDYMQKQLKECGYPFTTSAEREIVQDIKEKMGYVAMDTEMCLEKLYEMPDGQVISVGNTRFQSPELLFQEDGIHKMIYKSASKCVDLQKELYGNIVLAGGNTMFRGMAERVEKEVAMLANPSMKIKVRKPQNYAAWVGGSMMAAMASFQDKWVTKREYDEFGPSIVNKKCV